MVRRPKRKCSTEHSKTWPLPCQYILRSAVSLPIIRILGSERESYSEFILNFASAFNSILSLSPKSNMAIYKNKAHISTNKQQQTNENMDA